jgi:hypothetical protein
MPLAGQPGCSVDGECSFSYAALFIDKTNNHLSLPVVLNNVIQLDRKKLGQEHYIPAPFWRQSTHRSDIQPPSGRIIISILEV